MTSSDGTVEELVKRMFDPRVGPDDLARLREEWPGRLIVKGVQSVADAELVVEAGADAAAPGRASDGGPDRGARFAEIGEDLVSGPLTSCDRCRARGPAFTTPVVGAGPPPVAG
jgi:L-lactate dehydrogenase (cytochrome)